MRANLNVSKVIKEFEKNEKSSAHRKGTFKIEAPFEKAVNALLQAKPTKKLTSKKPSH